jgi:hypothetical protein
VAYALPPSGVFGPFDGQLSAAVTGRAVIRFPRRVSAP